MTAKPVTLSRSTRTTVIADTTPLNYLVLIHQADLLPSTLRRVLIRSFPSRPQSLIARVRGSGKQSPWLKRLTSINWLLPEIRKRGNQGNDVAITGLSNVSGPYAYIP
jgi:lambda repressor-like predicted transcriptional regulator